MSNNRFSGGHFEVDAGNIYVEYLDRYTPRCTHMHSPSAKREFWRRGIFTVYLARTGKCDLRGKAAVREGGSEGRRQTVQ